MEIESLFLKYTIIKHAHKYFFLDSWNDLYNWDGFIANKTRNDKKKKDLRYFLTIYLRLYLNTKES